MINNPPGESIQIRHAKRILDNTDTKSPKHQLIRAIKPRFREEKKSKVSNDNSEEEEWDDSANARISPERDSVNIVSNFKQKSRNTM